MRLLRVAILAVLGVSSTELNAQQSDLEKLYVAREYPALWVKLDSALQRSPNDKSLALMASQVLVELREFRKADELGERTIRIDGDNAWPSARAHIVLAQCAFVRGDTAEARRHLDRTIEMHATVNADKVARALKGEFGLDSLFGSWITAETEHIRFHYPPNSVIEDRVAFQKTRERALQRNNEFFGARLVKKIDMFVWNTDSAAVGAGLRPLGFARPSSLLIHTRHNQTPGHEITHILAGSERFIRTVPLINEGLAVFFDGSARNNAESAKAALHGRALSLRAVWTGAFEVPEEVLYPVGAVLIDALIRHGGKAKLLELLGDQTYENAQRVYGTDLDKILEEADRRLTVLSR